jgi:CRISPR-associated protein Csx17
VTTHVLNGFQPSPLASYLAGLGLIRLLGEQADRDLTVHWSRDGLVIDTEVTDIAAWLVDDYVPTPILSPWNGGSGFGERGTAREALEDLLAIPGPRLSDYRAAMAATRDVADRAATEGWPKERLVRELRGRCPDAMIPWIDAAVVLAGDQLYFPPLLGTGGNDGRLEFSHTFHKRLLEVLDPGQRERSRSWASDLLTGGNDAALSKAMIGQFDPAGSGGKNSSPFGDTESLANPWAFVLLIEGTTFFASSAARRHQHAAGRAARPFTVDASPDGSASGADGEQSRGEIWAPIWDRPFSVPEVTQLFSEARASWRGRPAQRAVEFYAATRTLGVARGVGAFQRYGLHQRNGLAFVAVPVERVMVREKPAVRLVAKFEDWVSWVRRGEATTAVGRAVRRFDSAHLTFVRSGETADLVTLLAALTDLEQAAGRSGRTRENVSVRQPPSARDFLDHFAELDSAEVRVAVGLASTATIAARGGPPARNLRHLLLPLDPDGRWRPAPVVPGFGMRTLPQVLADVMAWRSRTAAAEVDANDDITFRGVPTFRRGIPVPAADLHAFARGQLDQRRLDIWLRACLALRWDGVESAWQRSSGIAPLVPTLALLHPLAKGLAPSEADSHAPRLALAPDWTNRLAAGQVAAVHEAAARRLRQAGWDAVPAPPHTDLDGAALVAAMVPRCADDRNALSRVAIRLRGLQTDETQRSEPAEELA